MPDLFGWYVTPGGIIVALVPVALWVVALFCAIRAVRRGARPITYRFVIERLLRYVLIFPLGVQSLWTFVCHMLIPEQAAAAIGWQASPFQYEVGVANLGLGVASLYAAFAGFGARAAVAVMAACFHGGAGIMHLRDIAAGGNLAPGDVGPLVYTDFLTPIIILVLLLISPRSEPIVQAEPPKPEFRPGAPIETANSPRIEDELEKARQSLRESPTTGPEPEILPPLERKRLRMSPPLREGAADVSDA